MNFQPFPRQERTLGQCPGLPGMVCKPFLKCFCIERKTIHEADEPPEEGYLKQYLSKEEGNAAGLVGRVSNVPEVLNPSGWHP